MNRIKTEELLKYIVSIAVVLCLSVTVGIVLSGCSSRESHPPEDSSSSNNIENSATSENGNNVSEDEANAREAAKVAVEGRFSQYLELVGEKALFLKDYEISVIDNEVVLKVIGNFPIPVPKEAWDAAISEGIDPLASFNVLVKDFHRNELQGVMRGFLQQLYKDGRLSDDWSNKFNVVLIVKNREGEAIAEYR